MWQAKTTIITAVTLVVGFAGGFVLRPVIAPTQPSGTIAVGSPAAVMSSQARATQYFVAHIDEARQIAAGCRDGSVRGSECTNAEEAIIKVDAEERRKRFLSN